MFAEPALHPGVLTFAGFRLDRSRAELTRGGAVVALRPKALALLSYLATHPGRVLPKSELLAAVWPDVVVTEDSLSQCVVELRKTLGDSEQAIIRTVPRLGYRFDAPVQAEGDSAVEPLAVLDPPAVDAPAAAPRRRVRHAVLAGVAVLLAAAIGIGLGVIALRTPPLPSIGASLAAGRSVTVMPFVDLSEPPAPHFALGVTQQIVTELGSLQDATVIANAASAPASIAAVDVTAVGRQLGVRHVLTGSVLRAGERVQIQVQLTRTDSGTLEWGQRFDYVAVSDWNWRTDISQRVAASLDSKLLEGSVRAAWQESRSGTAVDEWMRGLYLIQHFTTRAELLQARQYFEAALAADPRSINALSGAAGTYLEEVTRHWSTDRKSAMATAREYGQRAMAIDPNHPESLRVLGNAYMFDAEFDLAHPLFARQLQVTPNSASAQRNMASVLLFTGRFAEAQPYARNALRLDPLGTSNLWKSHSILAQTLMVQRRTGEAIDELRLAQAAAPTVHGIGYMIVAAEAQGGHLEQARRELAELTRIDPKATVASVRASANSHHPQYLAGTQWLYDGLALAGLPQGRPLAAADATPGHGADGK